MPFIYAALLGVPLFYFSIRRLEIAIALVITGAAANFDFPVQIAGAPLNSLRLSVALLAIALVVRGLPKTIQTNVPKDFVLYNVMFLGLIAIALYHSLVNVTEVSAVIPLVFNLILTDLLVIALNSLSEKKIRSLFFLYIPSLLIATAVYFLFKYHAHLAKFSLELGSELRTGYRARADEERNLLNAWAATLVLFAPLVLRSWIDPRSSTFYRLLGMSAAVLLVALSLTTFSRSSAGVLVISVFFALALLAYDGGIFSRLHRRILLKATLAVIVLLALGALFVSIFNPDFRIATVVYDFWVQRYNASFEDDASIGSRLLVLDESFSGWAQAPFLGHGSADAAGIVRPTENTFLAVAINYGIVGLGLYLGSFFIIFRIIVREWSLGRKLGRVLVPVWFFMYVLLLVTNDFLAFSSGTIVLAILMANRNGRGKANSRSSEATSLRAMNG